MVHGRSYTKPFNKRLRCNRVCVQKVRYPGYGWTRGSYLWDDYSKTQRRRFSRTVRPEFPFADVLVRGLFARRSVGRKHALRKLEASNTRAVAKNVAESAFGVQRQREGCSGVASRFVQRDQPAAPSRSRDDAHPTTSDTQTESDAVQIDGRPVGGQRSHRIFQKMEWNLLGKYVSASDWWNFRLTCRSMVPEKWTWDVIWRGPAVFDAYAACRFVHALSANNVDDVMMSITSHRVLRMAFVILDMRGDAREVACRCRIGNLTIWRSIS